jgi:SAM-dependent methyltransferase
MDDGERELLAATFDLDAKGYDDGRPDHPVEAWDIVLRSAGLRPNYRVLEIGPAAPFTIETCSLETADLVAGSFDAVFAATSFHWVDPEVGVPILRRVLKPGAPLCL